MLQKYNKKHFDAGVKYSGRLTMPSECVFSIYQDNNHDKILSNKKEFIKRIIRAVFHKSRICHKTYLMIILRYILTQPDLSLLFHKSILCYERPKTTITIR